MEEFYHSNLYFKVYVDLYCNKHKCTVEEALEYDLVKSVYEQYKSKFLCRRDNEKIVN